MDDEELIFKRFPDEKQEQVRQLVGFATLMGLSGKDLVSIGGKLDRIVKIRERERLRDIVRSMDLKAAKSTGAYSIDSWYYTTGGVKYHFKGDSWMISITNMSTKKRITINNIPNYYFELGKFYMFGNSSVPRVMLNVWDGSITLP
jgi:hypothetical protein